MLLRRRLFGTSTVGSAICLAMGVATVSLGLTRGAQAQTGVVVDGRAAADAIPSPLDAGKPWNRYLTEQGFLAAKFIAVADDYQGAGAPLPTQVAIYKASTAVNIARTGPGGVAQLSAVREGTHGLVATGPNGISATGFYLASGNGGGVLAPQIVTYLSPAADMQKVLGLLHAPGAPQAPGHVVPDADLQGMRDPGPMSYYLQPDGSFLGRFVSVDSAAAQAAAGMKVSVIRRGEVLSESTTDEWGIFKATNVSPGLVTIVAVGANGFAVYGASVAGTVVSAVPGDRETTYVALQGPPGPPSQAVAPPGAMAGFQQAVQTALNGLGAAPPGAPFGGGGGGFGGGSGGGGFGGGGGALGAALGALGAGLGAAALADDDDPVSPAGP